MTPQRVTQDVDAAFQLVEQLARAATSRRVVGDQPLVAAVQGGFDRVGVLDVDAQHVGDQAADERELLLALAEDATSRPR